MVDKTYKTWWFITDFL